MYSDNPDTGHNVIKEPGQHILLQSLEGGTMCSISLTLSCSHNNTRPEENCVGSRKYLNMQTKIFTPYTNIFFMMTTLFFLKLRFLHKNDVGFAFTSYCVVVFFLFFFILCTLYHASFTGLSIFEGPFGIL